ncbi:MAG: nucleoside phosphorylase [Spirochaetes bacterium]|nr:nucleoside phosphorylase [Spirochaetota bacterium]
MAGEKFIPHHMNITEDDIKGNNGIGRYIILPGSNGRAEKIAGIFHNVSVKKHPRCHNFYMGYVKAKGRKVDVASVASGMGSPSLDIIVNELYRLGAGRILRVGTAGSLQPSFIRVGALVIPTASVRDETASACYTPREVPATASLAFIEAAVKACSILGLDNVFTGTVHSKDSLYAREFREGPMAAEHERYMRILKDSGVLASEMECSMLFTLGAVFNQQLRTLRAENTQFKDDGFKGSNPHTSDEHVRENQFLTGAVLAIIGDDSAFADVKLAAKAVDDSIKAGIETVKQLAIADMGL